MEEEFDSELYNSLINDEGSDNNDNDILDLLPLGDQNQEDTKQPLENPTAFDGNLYNADNDQGDSDDEPVGTDDKEEYSELTKNKVIDNLLSKKGITDSLVKYEDEAGNIEEVDFYELPLKDQLAILQSNDSDINFGLNENEISTVNFLRENGASFEDAVEYFKREAVKEYIDNQNISGIQIDQYDDEELFSIDLKARYEDLNEEEIQIELTKQLEHPDLFKKKIDKIRSEYKEIELNQLETAKLEESEKETHAQQELQDSLIGIAEQIEDIGGLDLDNNDKNEVLSFVLQKDLNGVTELDKALKDPNTLFDIAWYATKGKQAFDILHDYYKKQIESVSKTSYEKGKSDSKNNAAPKGRSFVRTGTNNNKKTLSIDDLKID